MRMANEMEVCDMSKKLIMGAVMALALVVCIPQTASAKQNGNYLPLLKIYRWEK